MSKKNIERGDILKLKGDSNIYRAYMLNGTLFIDYNRKRTPISEIESQITKVKKLSK